MLSTTDYHITGISGIGSQHNALHDALTGLPNRALFTKRVKYSLALAKQRADYLFAVLFLDFDRFKIVNDKFGHLVGDQLLVAIARRLEKCVRPNDTIARLGGDEFTILLEEIKDSSDAIQVADRIHQELTFPFSLSGHEVSTSASIGIALNKPEYNLPEDLLRDADTAMYQAKVLGKACHKLFS
jgi:diguanylate cyclase (GGDEF)-like protein